MAKTFDPYHVWLGIPPEHRPPTYYQLLGIVPDEQDRDVIQAASLRLSAYVRNFQTGKHSDDANRILTELAEARSCLLDAASRRRYDASLLPAPTKPAAYAAPPNRPATSNRPPPSAPRQAPAAPAPVMAPRVTSPPVIEMADVIAGDSPALAARAVALPAPRRRVGRVARQQTSPLIWILPLAFGLLAVVVMAVVVMRPTTPVAPPVIDGQFVTTAPPQPVWQPAPQPPLNNQPTINPPSVNPPVTVERRRFNSRFTRPPSFGPNPPPGNMSSSPPGNMGSSPSMNMGTSTPPASLGQAEKPTAPPAKFVPPPERKPVPTGAALTSARREVDAAFAKEFRSAKTLSQKTAAVRQLFEQSQSAEKTALRYAYLKECSDRAINMGDAGLAFEALEEMGRLFEIEAPPLKLDALKLALNKSPQPEQAYTIAMLALAARNRLSMSASSLAEQFDALATAAGRKARLLTLSEPIPRRNRGSGGLPFLGVSQPGLAASYFDGSEFDQELLRRVDSHIDFQFSSKSADPSLPAGHFSVRWTGWLTPPVSGKYIITATANGGVRMKIGDQTPVDSLQMMFGPYERTSNIELASVPYPIVIEYAQRGVRGGVRLSWAVKERSTDHTIPAEAFSHERMIGE